MDESADQQRLVGMLRRQWHAAFDLAFYDSGIPEAHRDEAFDHVTRMALAKLGVQGNGPIEDEKAFMVEALRTIPWSTRRHSLTDDLGAQYIPREKLPGPKRGGWVVRVLLRLAEAVKRKGAK